MRILLTGGTGFVGRALVAALCDDGHQSVVLSRRDKPPVSWPSGATLRRWSGPPAAIPPDAIDGVDAVINLAGESIGGGRWSKRRKDILWISRVETTRLLREAIDNAAQKPRIMISGSAVGYYGFHGDEEITEAESPGSDFLATLCSHWEEAAKPVVRHGVRLMLLRTGVVFENGSALARMMLPFRLFVGGPVGNGGQYLSWIHRADLIGVIRFALSNERLSGPVNAVSPQPQTNRAFSRSLGRIMRRPSFVPTPAFALRLALGEMADLILEGQRVVPRRLAEFGFQYKYPDLESALRAILVC
jgi:hypothetical protein